MPIPEAIPAPSRRGLARRAFLASSLALGACSRSFGETTTDTATAPVPSGPVPLLRDLAPFPIGTEIVTDQLPEPVFDQLARTQFSQITTGYELKMEYVLQADGSMRFDGGDRIAAFCRENSQLLHCHTLVWYHEDPAAFRALDGNPAAFGAAYDRYIQTLVGRHAGHARGWDVVNEPVMEDGEGLRESLWTRNLGQDGHFIRAFEQAHAADPQAVLFVNEYNLESRPAKRATFMKLIEAMLKRGVPIGGIGNQSHLVANLPPGQITAAMKDLASLGLPIHVSEFDCSLQTGRLDFRSRAEKEAAQAGLYAEAVEAFMALPARQRYAFSFWGIRDTDSWLRMPSYGGDLTDAPLAFDDQGKPKATFWAMVNALKRRTT